MKRIPLTQGQVALIDDSDFSLVSKYKWFANKGKNNATYYAYRSVILPNGHPALIAMHRLIVGANESQQVDHIDRNGLNNRRSNLRIATQSQNSGNAAKRKDNTSGYKGVSWHRAMRKWQARIRIKKERIVLGYFDDLREAARSYDDAARKHFGEFARTNFRKGD